MRRRRARRQAEEFLWRTIEIRSVAPSVSLHSEARRGEEPRIESSSWLEVRGDLDSPVKDVFDITIHVHPEEPLRVGTVRPVAVGSIIGISCTVSVVVSLLPVDFDRLWVLALSGNLKFASLRFTQPKYGSAVVNTSFSSVREE
jgi:hypothetical protein